MSGIFNKDIAVLDVNSELISAIIGTKKSHTVFGIESNVAKEHLGFMNGEWADRHDTEQVAKTVLLQALKEADSKAKKLFISVPAEFISVNTKEVSITLDKKRVINEDDIKALYKKGAVFDTKDFCLINTKPAYFFLDDSESSMNNVIGMEAETICACVSYVLAEKSYIEMFDEIAEDCGFYNVVFIGTPLAEALSLLEKEERNDIYTLIDVGYLSSSVSIGINEGILCLKSFSLGSADIAGDIYNYLEVPYENALIAQKMVDLNLNYADDAVLVNTENGSILANDVADITKYRLDMLVDIISDIMKDYEEIFPSNMKVYLTGEGIAPIRGAKKYLSEHLGMNIEILTPKLPGFVKPDDSSRIALLLMAENMAKGTFAEKLKKLFVGGNRL